MHVTTCERVCLRRRPIVRARGRVTRVMRAAREARLRALALALEVRNAEADLRLALGVEE